MKKNKDIPPFPKDGSIVTKFAWCDKYIKFEKPTKEDINRAKESFRKRNKK